MKKIKPIDAQKLHKESPTAFKVPSNKELDQIKKGSVVKICVGGERFWVSVTKVSGKKITGRVDNDLVNTDAHGLRYNDAVEFEKRNVYSIFSDRT